MRNPNSRTEPLLKAEEVAEIVKVTPQCINYKRRRGEIPAAICSGAVIRYRLSEVAAAMEGKRADA